MKRLLSVLPILAMAVLAVAQSNTNVQGGNFKGQVRYDNNTPASHVKVEIWSDGGTFRTTVNTDETGRFQVQAPFAVIQFKIEIPGYRPVYGRDDLSMSGRADEMLTLKALPGTTPPAAALPATIDARVAAITPDAKKEFDAGEKAMGSNDM